MKIQNINGKDFRKIPQLFDNRIVQRFVEECLLHTNNDYNLSYEECGNIANYFSSLVYDNNKVAEFQMITNLNVGVELDDLYKLTELQIHEKYNMEMLTKQRIDEYKNLIGLEI